MTVYRKKERPEGGDFLKSWAADPGRQTIVGLENEVHSLRRFSFGKGNDHAQDNHHRHILHCTNGFGMCIRYGTTKERHSRW